MKKLAWGLAALLVIAGIAAYLNRDLLAMMASFGRMKPDHPFAQEAPPPEPDYAQAANWAALPDRADAADVVPEGSQDSQASAPVDVFFVHPTTYYKPEHWNQPLTDAQTNAFTDEFVMKNQASAFNGCCRVYAPRYRQATVYSFLDEGSDGKAALALAYEDVERAFDHFIGNFSAGRPFILAGHSQGALHLRTLLERRITGTPLAARLVAAYPIGFAFDRDEYARAVPDVPVCERAEQTGCSVTWNSVGPRVRSFYDTSRSVCVNPLTWRIDGDRADFAMNPGAVTFSQGFGVDAVPVSRAQPSTEPGAADAQCVEGMLRVSEIRSRQFGARPMGRDNYHIYDFGLFYMSLRANAQARVAAYLAAQADQPIAADSQRSSEPRSMAPDWRATSLPLRKAISVGMPRMPKRDDSAGSSSEFTLAKRAFVPARRAASS